MGTDKQTILVIEDCRTTLRLVVGMVKRLGYDVREAGNGSAGLAQLRRSPAPVAAIVDWTMPEMDGMEFVRRVRSDPEQSNLRILIATSRHELADVRAALRTGADEFLMKPFTIEMLTEKLRLLGLEIPNDNVQRRSANAW